MSKRHELTEEQAADSKRELERRVAWALACGDLEAADYWRAALLSGVQS